jgi:hypothetical protein
MSLLLGLLAISYFGSMVMRGRALRGRGRQSGAEWVLLGLITGPNVLGAFEPEALGAFEPVAAVAVSWLALVIGVGIVGRGGPRAQKRALSLGVVLALATGAGVAAAAYFAALYSTHLRGTRLWIAALGIGLCSCATARHPVDWAIERFGADGPLARMLSGIADLDDMLPLLLIAIPFAFAPVAMPGYALPWWGLCLLPLGLGAVMGTMCAALLRFEARASAAWGLLLGTALLSTGVSWRLGLSSLTTMFAMGVTLSLLSRHRAELREMLARTEQPVLLPILLLAGARVHVAIAWPLWVVLGVACVSRLLVRSAAAPVLVALTHPGARGASGPLGLGLMSTGALTMAVGLSFALRFPSVVGELVLSAAAVQTVLGEMLGPASLRRALAAAGELDPGALSMPTPPPAPEDALAASAAGEGQAAS